MGTHVLCELFGVSFTRLNDAQAIMLAFDRAVDAMGATVLNKYHHKFSPQGVTVLYALAESHISCHTSPEIGEVAIDCFTCGSMNPEKGMDVLVKHFNPIETRIRVISR